MQQTDNNLPEAYAGYNQPYAANSKNILLAAYETSDLPRMVNLAIWHKQHGDNVYFLIPLGIPVAAVYPLRLEQNSIPLFELYKDGVRQDLSLLAGQALNRPVPPDMLFADWKKHFQFKGNGWLKERLYSCLAKKAGVFDDFRAVFNDLAFTLQIYSKACRILDLDLVMFPALDTERTDSLLWRTLEKLGFVKTLVVHPWILFRSLIYEAYKNHPNFLKNYDCNRKVWKYLPRRWRVSLDGHDLLRLPLPFALAQEALGIALPQPHLTNSGADNIVCDSLYQFNKLAEYGIDADRTTDITGLPEQDELFAKTEDAKSKAEFFQTAGFEPAGKKIILLNVPRIIQNLPPCFASFAHAIIFIIQTLARAEHWQVVISPHPSLDENTLAEFQGYGAIVSKMNIAQLLAYADLCVSAISTADIMSLALGTPVVEYDLGRYRHRNFADVESVITCDEETKFMQVIAKLQDDDAFFTAFKQKAFYGRDLFGVIDGGSCERICTVGRRVLMQKPLLKKRNNELEIQMTHEDAIKN